MEEMHLNWLAIAVAVVAQMVIGYIWFHPSVMGKMWADANGKTVEEMKPKNPRMVYGIAILYTILFTMFLVQNVTGPGQDKGPDGHSFHTFEHGVFHSIILAILVFLPVLGTPSLFEGKPKDWLTVQLGYWLVRTSVAAGILSLWR